MRLKQLGIKIAISDDHPIFVIEHILQTMEWKHLGRRVNLLDFAKAGGDRGRTTRF